MSGRRRAAMSFLSSTSRHTRCSRDWSSDVCSSDLSASAAPDSKDAIRSYESGAALAELAGGTLVTVEGSGHAPHARDPVKVNLLLRDFACPAAQIGRASCRGRV